MALHALADKLEAIGDRSTQVIIDVGRAVLERTTEIVRLIADSQSG